MWQPWESMMWLKTLRRLHFDLQTKKLKNVRNRRQFEIKKPKIALLKWAEFATPSKGLSVNCACRVKNKNRPFDDVLKCHCICMKSEWKCSKFLNVHSQQMNRKNCFVVENGFLDLHCSTINLDYWSVSQRLNDILSENLGRITEALHVSFLILLASEGSERRIIETKCSWNITATD